MLLGMQMLSCADDVGGGGVGMQVMPGVQMLGDEEVIGGYR